MTDRNVPFDGERQSQPDPGVAGRVRQRASELYAIALVDHAAFDRRVVIERH